MDCIKSSLQKKISCLPPLPESVYQIERICRDPEASINQLVTVVEQDPLLTANLLRTANSAYYGFAREVTTVHQAVTLFGMSMVWGFAIESATRESFTINLTPYNLTVNQFAELSRTESSLMWHWFSQQDPAMAAILIPTSFISRIGMVIIAAQIEEHGLEKKFASALKNLKATIESQERKFVGNSNQEICSAIFAQWNFEQTMVAAIRASENPERWEPEMQPYAFALKSVQTAVTSTGTITKDSSAAALDIAKKGGLDQVKLLSAIENIVNQS